MMAWIKCILININKTNKTRCDITKWNVDNKKKQETAKHNKTEEGQNNKYHEQTNKQTNNANTLQQRRHTTTHKTNNITHANKHIKKKQQTKLLHIIHSQTQTNNKCKNNKPTVDSKKKRTRSTYNKTQLNKTKQPIGTTHNKKCKEQSKHA